jgi:HAD superfamily hydrolase (TIGR01549 family)
MSIKTIFLDAGGVLVNPNWERVSRVLGKYGVTVDARLLREVEPNIKYALDRDNLVRTTSDQDRFITYLQMIFDEAGCGTAPSDAFEELHAYQAEFNLWESVDPEVYTTLGKLRSDGYKLVVVSNSNGTLHRSFTRLGLIDKVDLVFDSHEHHLEKPDPAFFRLALEQNDSIASETVHVGDFYHIDVVGAESAGISAVLLDNANLYSDRDCLRIETFAELPKLLSKAF